MASQLPPPQPAADAAPVFSVDAEGTGAGRIVSETGDVYEGSFLKWQRHGWGLQRWASGESFRGTWLADAQERGVFTDAQGRKWKGNFHTGEVQRMDGGVASAVSVSEDGSTTAAAAAGTGNAGEDMDDDIAAAVREELEEEEQQQRQQQQQQRGPDEHKENVTHFPASAAYAYRSQHDPSMAQTQQLQSLGHTMPMPFSVTAQQLPPPPQSARSHRSTASLGGRRRGNQTARGIVRQPPPRRETPAERAEREQREKAEEKIVLNELKQATYLLGGRYGSNRVPFEATLYSSPGPAAYDPSLSQVKRTPIAHSMAPKLPYTSEVAQLVKATSSAGPWSSNVGHASGRINDLSRPTVPAVSTSRPPLLPQYVKDSAFFVRNGAREVPGPGAYDVQVSARGKATTLQSVAGSTGLHAHLLASGAPPPPLGGSTVKGRYIPVFTSYAHIARSQLGQGPCPGSYTPRVDKASTHEASPSFSMGGRYKTAPPGGSIMGQYDVIRAARLPGPGQHSPSISGVRPDPAAQAPAWGRSRAGQRVHPTESVRAIAYPGDERLLRNQLGLASPGPAAYSPAIDACSTRPAPTNVNFAPHIVQPQAVRVARQFVQTGHPFVKKFAARRAKERGEETAAAEDDAGAEQGDES